MRSLLVLAAAAAGFLGYLVWHHGKAGDLVAREEAALERLARGTAAGEQQGYRFSTAEGGGLPSVRVAAPIRPAVDGTRWFAADERAVYEFNTVLFEPDGDAPDLAPLRRWLAGGAEDRPPFGWRRVR